MGILYNGRHLRSFSLSRIYYKYIKEREIEKVITLDEMIKFMMLNGFIVLSTDKTRYSELPKLNQFDKEEFINYVYKTISK